MVPIILGVLGAIAGFGLMMLRILREYERAVVFRLGRLKPARGPGLVVLWPFGLERMVKVSLRIVAMDIPPQDVITRDNVSVKVNAVVYFRVSDPVKAVVEIEDYLFATSQLAQTTLRSVVGQAELDELLAERERINTILRDLIDEGTDSWGIDVSAVEVKDIDLPQEMKRAMARQAEAERERRAKVINAEGELQASKKLSEAAGVMSREPASISLRFLQTVTEIAAENNSTTLFPIPIDLFRPMIEKAAKAVDSLTGDTGDDGDESGDEAPGRLPGSRMELGAGTGEAEAEPARREEGARDTGPDAP
ncbi:MAG: slipin family protein [Longimicrobiales bacterium]|nr:slipin family protein [Longimicrobiales bacterium]